MPAPNDPQQLLIRRAIAVAVGALVLIVLVVGIRGCLATRKENALKDYNRSVAGVVQQANENSDAFFQTLTTGARSSTDLQTQVNQLRVRAEGQTRTARGFDVPGEMKQAHDDLLLALTLIDQAIGRVAEKLPAALASDSNAAEDAVMAIAADMQAFTAADVVYSQRVAALIQQKLNDKEIGGQTIQASSFQENLGWLVPATVATRINSEAGKGAGGGATAEVRPGLHGHGLVSAAVAGQALQPGGGANRIRAGSNLAFTVTIANQGDNDESDVRVRVRIRGAGEPITVQRTVDQTKAGSNAEVSVPLGEAPPIATPVTIEIEVRPVPGEKKTDNNKQEYTAFFER